MDTLRVFTAGGRTALVQYIETTPIKTGVTCDIYAFEGDSSRDLAIVTVNKNSKTPLQRVLGGDRTLEGFMSGKGTLRVIRADGSKEDHNFPNNDVQEIEVRRSDVMQWHAAKDADLVFYEICHPPYKAGRFEEIKE